MKSIFVTYRKNILRSIERMFGPDTMRRFTPNIRKNVPKVDLVITSATDLERNPNMMQSECSPNLSLVPGTNVRVWYDAKVRPEHPEKSSKSWPRHHVRSGPRAKSEYDTVRMFSEPIFVAWVIICPRWSVFCISLSC